MPACFPRLAWQLEMVCERLALSKDAPHASKSRAQRPAAVRTAASAHAAAQLSSSTFSTALWSGPPQTFRFRTESGSVSGGGGRCTSAARPASYTTTSTCHVEGAARKEVILELAHIVVLPLAKLGCIKRHNGD